MSEIRDYHRAEIEQARQKRCQLGSKSHVGNALTDETLLELAHRVETASEPDLTYGFWPYIFGFILLNGVEALAELDADLDLVLGHTDAARKNSVSKFLQTRDRRTGTWFGGLFEVWSKATFLKKAADVHLDVPLPNGRDHDASAVIGGRRIHFECTVLTQDDEAREVWSRFMEHKKLDPNKVLVRPGPLCPPNAKGPSPYYETLRLFQKVYDKITKNLEPANGQFLDTEPNILLTCFAGPGVDSDRPGVKWGYEELFACHPRMARTVVPESFTDISLEAWVDYRANEFVTQRNINVEWYCDNSHRVLEAPRRLGGALLFDNSSLAAGRVNYNAWEKCKVSHAEIAQCEQLLARPVSYFKHYGQLKGNDDTDIEDFLP